MEIISRKLANDRLYGYEKGVFWVWDEGRKVWKESILMGKQYGLNREVDKSLTPADFLADPSRFCPLEDYEVEYEMKNARRVRKDPEKQAPVTQQAPARTAPAVPEKQAEAAETPAEVPEFDYSGLDEKGVADLHTAEAEYQHGKRLAERGLVHMGEAVAIAHDVLVAQCNGHKNQHSDESFRAWCVSIGISKDTAYRLLQVSGLIQGSTSRQKQVLEALPQTLLYAVAKPSAPAELVERVKSGEISTNKEYQAELAKLRAEKEQAEDRARAAEADLTAALADVQGLAKENEKLETRLKNSCVAEQNAREAMQSAEAERDRAAQRAAKAEEALKHQPIAGVVDEEEVDRRAHQQAYSIAEDMTGELRAQNEELTRQLAERPAGESDPETDHATVCSCLTSMMAMWSVAFAALTRLQGDSLRTASEYAEETARSILQDVGALVPELAPEQPDQPQK